MTALLIERCNEYQTSFIDYICSVKETNISLADAEVKAIREALVVRSMEEVKERFAPQVSVTLNEENIIIPLCHKAGFFQTVISLWENIKQGKYTDITLEDFEESLLAKDGCLEEEFVKVQEQIFFYLQKNQYGEAKVQVEKCMTSFDDSLFLLKRLLKQGEKFFQEQEKKHRRFVVETKKEMSLQCVAVSEAFLKSSYHTTKLEDNYQQLLEEVFLNMQTEENAQKSYQRMLLYWNLLLACQNLDEQKQKQLKRILEEQKVIYKETKESFWQQAKPVLQTLLHCYVYFHKPDARELLITNCTVEELADARCRKALLRYLETANRKVYQEDAVAKVILPNIEEKKLKQKLTRERFATGQKKGGSYRTNQLETARGLQSIFTQFAIETSMLMCDEGELAGYALTGIDVYNQSDGKEAYDLRKLTIWLNEFRILGEEI